VTGAPVDRYPLSWPPGWKRTTARQVAQFGARRTQTSSDGQRSWTNLGRLSVAESMGRLQRELDLLRATHVVLSSNVAIRLDGLPRSGQPEPRDPGVAVYFQLAGKPRCLACDRWTRVADNVAAIAAHVGALRAMDRWGVGTTEQAFAGFVALPPSAEEWWIVLGVPPSAPWETVEAAYRVQLKKHHPDAGGSDAAMARINAARDLAAKAIKRTES
jgi:DnaJ-domain-containing protein 1